MQMWNGARCREELYRVRSGLYREGIARDTFSARSRARARARTVVALKTVAASTRYRKRWGGQEGGAVSCAAFAAGDAAVHVCADYLLCCGALTAMAVVGKSVGSGTRVGRLLSPPVCAMLVGFMATKALEPLVPFDGQTFSGVMIIVKRLQTTLVQLATPLMLFDADIVRIIRGRVSSSLLVLFFVAAAGTLMGSVVGTFVFGTAMTDTLGGEGGADAAWKLAGALCAKNIGGGMNYVAAATVFSLEPRVFAMGLAVDNVAALIYFPLCSYLGSFGRYDPSEGAGEPHVDRETRAATNAGVAENARAMPRMRSASLALLISLSVTVVSNVLAPSPFEILAATAMTITIASVPALSRFMPRAMVDSGQALGTALLYIFFASAGVSAAAYSVAFYPSWMGFLITMYVVHFVFVLGFAWLSGADLPLALIASSASIGNPATAASLATSKGWNELILPGILVGQLGNAVATFASTIWGYGVLRWLL